MLEIGIIRPRKLYKDWGSAPHLVELMIEERDTKESSSITPIGKFRYLFGLLILLGAAYSQYVLGGFGPVLGFLFVYGIPIVVVSILWRRAVIQKAEKNTRTAFKLGVGFYGVLQLWVWLHPMPYSSPNKVQRCGLELAT
jgi:hypothetical protein